MILLDLPCAISTPVLTGVFGVGGALVGALAGSLPDVFFAARREQAFGKAGARLVAAELAIADAQLRGAEKDKEWWRFHKLPMASWNEYRQVLASKLSNEEFEAVSQAAIVLGYFGESILEVPGFRDPERESIPVEAEKIRAMRPEVAAAYNALAGLAGHDRVKEFIHPPDGETPPSS